MKRLAIAAIVPLGLLAQTREVAHDVRVIVAESGAMAPQGHIQFIAAEGGFTASLNPVKGAPYTAEGANEFTQTLADGTRITRKSVIKKARDSEGRTRSEVDNTVAGPVAVPGVGLPSIMIHDPVARETIILDQKEKIARRMKFPPLEGSGEARRRTSEGEARTVKGETKWHASHTSSQSSAQSQGGEVRAEADVIIHRAVPGYGETFNLPVPPPAEGIGGIAVAYRGGGQKESLGKQTISGLVCEGTRMTNAIPQGQIGNDRQIQIVTESWYSPDLKLTVMTRTLDPLHGESAFRLHTVSRSEPAKSLFQVPADYTVKEDTPPAMMIQRKIEKK
jgi:hypothetical protein